MWIKVTLRRFQDWEDDIRSYTRDYYHDINRANHVSLKRWGSALQTADKWRKPPQPGTGRLGQGSCTSPAPGWQRPACGYNETGGIKEFRKMWKNLPGLDLHLGGPRQDGEGEDPSQTFGLSTSQPNPSQPTCLHHLHLKSMELEGRFNKLPLPGPALPRPL